MSIKINNAYNIPLRLPPILSWLKLLAVFLVFSGHSKTLFGRGHGAIFFMVLSGYTFTRFFIKEWTETGKIKICKFLNKRVSKLIPPLLIVLIFNLFIKIWHHHPVDETQFLSVATFTTNYFNALNGHPNNGLAHLWTLSLVMQFYLVWPFFFLLLVNHCRSLKQITIVLSLVILTVMAYRSILLYLNLATNAYLFNSFETRIDCFLIGALFAFNIECSLFQKIRQLVLKYKWSLLTTILAITSMTSMSQFVRNSVGFDLHATLIGIFIVQLGALDELSFGIFNHSELLSDVTYWFYLLHPWGNTLGEMIKINPYAQFLFGGTILLICVTLFCYTMKEARLPAKVSNLFR